MLKLCFLFKHYVTLITDLFFIGRLCGIALILYYELNKQPKQLIFFLGIYVLLTIGAWLYLRGKSIKLGISNHIS